MHGLLSTFVSDRLITIAPCTMLGLALFAVCAKALKLLSPRKSYLRHFLSGGLQ
jgi:hypothetical protein